MLGPDLLVKMRALVDSKKILPAAEVIQPSGIPPTQWAGGGPPSIPEVTVDPRILQAQRIAAMLAAAPNVQVRVRVRIYFQQIP
jgi:hypothetical protein